MNVISLLLTESKTLKAERRPTLLDTCSVNTNQFVHFLRVEGGNLSSHSNEREVYCLIDE